MGIHTNPALCAVYRVCSYHAYGVWDCNADSEMFMKRATARRISVRRREQIRSGIHHKRQTSFKSAKENGEPHKGITLVFIGTSLHAFCFFFIARLFYRILSGREKTFDFGEKNEKRRTFLFLLCRLLWIECAKKTSCAFIFTRLLVLRQEGRLAGGSWLYIVGKLCV